MFADSSRYCEGCQHRDELIKTLTLNNQRMSRALQAILAVHDMPTTVHDIASKALGKEDKE